MPARSPSALAAPSIAAILYLSQPCGLLPRCAPGLEFNQSANFVQTNPNKTKQKSLDFLGIVRPNWDFSMGCGQKNKKIDSRLKLCAKRLKRFPLPSSAGAREGAGSIRRLGKV
jgi:hypothetical protein